MTEQAQQQPPTPQQAAEVSQAVAQAAADAPTAAQARTDAADAAREAAKREKLEIPEEQIQAIANGVVDALEQRGAFDAPIEPVAPPPAPVPAADGSQPDAAGATPVEQTPRKRTFAQKFLGE